MQDTARRGAPGSKRLARIGCCTALVVLVLGVVLPEVLGRRPYVTWLTPGRVQVLQGPDGVWVFLEVRRCVTRTAPFASPSYVAHTVDQRVIRIRPDGTSLLQDCAPEPSLSLGELVWDDSTFYFLCWGSPNHPRHLYRWTGRQFECLATTEATQWLQRLGVADASPFETTARLRSHTEQSGWRAVALGDSEKHTALATVGGIRVYAEMRGSTYRLLAEGAQWRVLLLEIDTHSRPATVEDESRPAKDRDGAKGADTVFMFSTSGPFARSLDFRPVCAFPTRCPTESMDRYRLVPNRGDLGPGACPHRNNSSEVASSL